MTEHNSLLDALTHKGVLISVNVRYWRAKKKLNPEDLGLSRDRIDDKLISLGHKRLVPKDSLKELSLLESRAHALVEENTFPFLDGVAHYLPNSKLEEVTEKLRALQADFHRVQAEFISGYTKLREMAIQQWQTAANTLVPDPGRLVAVISAAFPPAESMPRYFGFEIRMFQLAVPEVPQAELIELGTQQEIMEARRQAAESARHEIEHACQEFIADCAATLREQTAKLCQEMLETISTTGTVHQKTLNRLLKFIEHFRELNFIGDAEIDEQLQKVRDEFLGRTAVEYRDNRFARQQLVGGLTALREKARELAGQDTQSLVESFGQMGRRRFSLAA